MAKAKKTGSGESRKISFGSRKRGNPQKSYNKHISFISPIDTLKLEMKPLAIISFCYMLQYVYEHDEKLINNLLVPEELEKNKHMTIEYNSIQQLNIKNQGLSNNNEKCLQDIHKIIYKIIYNFFFIYI